MLATGGAPTRGQHLHHHSAPTLGAVTRRFEFSGRAAAGVVTLGHGFAAPIAPEGLSRFVSRVTHHTAHNAHSAHTASATALIGMRKSVSRSRSASADLPSVVR